MQQLFSAFGVSWNLIIAQAVNFGIVLIALWYFLYKPVLAMLAKRQSVIAKGVEDAAHVEKLFTEADTEASRRVKVADNEAEKILALARDSAAQEKARLMKEAEERAARVAKEADERATEVLARARRESESDIARLAILAAEKVMQKKHD